MGNDYLVSVVGAAVVIVPESEGWVAHDDVINSVLLAQLVANKEVEKNPEINWYDAYVKVLDGFWLRPTKAREERLITEHCGESVVEWVVAAMAKGAPDEGRAVGATLARVASVSGTEPAMSLLRSSMQKTSADESTEVPVPARIMRLLLILARTPTSVTSVYLEFKTRQEISPNPLAQLFRAEDVQGTVSMRYARVCLAETLYGPARDAIALKVREKRKGHVAMLTLTDDSSGVQVPEEIES